MPELSEPLQLATIPAKISGSAIDRVRTAIFEVTMLGNRGFVRLNALIRACEDDTRAPLAGQWVDVTKRIEVHARQSKPDGASHAQVDAAPVLNAPIDGFALSRAAP